MPRQRNYNRTTLGVTIKATKEIVERYAALKEWSLSYAADDLIKAGAIARGITSDNHATQTSSQK